jgi:hypothetical protein
VAGRGEVLLDHAGSGLLPLTRQHIQPALRSRSLMRQPPNKKRDDHAMILQASGKQQIHRKN